jgi:hypothetical protein
MKVILVANACQWASWPEKIAAIKAFYSPLVELDIDISHTDFADIPLASYPGTVTQFTANGPVDVAGNDLEIDLEWFGENVAPLITGYDIAIFQAANVTADGLPLGIKFEDLNGTWCCETFVPDENFTYTLPGVNGGVGVTLGNEAEIIIEHEISHALYSISGQPDRTHQFFYANQFSRVLTDIVLPTASPLVKLYQELVAVLQSELGILKSQKSAADMDNAIAQLAKEASSTFPPMIEKWITAISQWEGAIPAHHNPGNLKYSTLTASWGATRGPAASDGGYLCQFATDNAGEIALGNFLTLGCENELIAFHSPEARTLKGFTVIYAGNPPQDYIDGIITGLGVPGDTQISTFLS